MKKIVLIGDVKKDLFISHFFPGPFQVSDLKQHIELLSILGCRVLRHEEFEEGCEASCNGPYSGHWSKTMVGWANEDDSFVFELTFNYGIYRYARGNDLVALVLHKYDQDGVDMETKMLSSFPAAKESYCPTDKVYRLVNDDLLLRFDDSRAMGAQLIKGVEINTTNLAQATAYWRKIGLVDTIDQEDKGGVTADQERHTLCCPGYEDRFTLTLRKLSGDPIERGEAFGRLAFACADQDVEMVFRESGSKVLNAPITLKTEGKADVVVTILQSPDDQEICFVNDTGFRDLSQETGEKIDWQKYDEQNERQKKFMSFSQP